MQNVYSNYWINFIPVFTKEENLQFTICGLNDVDTIYDIINSSPEKNILIRVIFLNYYNNQILK